MSLLRRLATELLHLAGPTVAEFALLSNADIDQWVEEHRAAS